MALSWGVERRAEGGGAVHVAVVPCAPNRAQVHVAATVAADAGQAAGPVARAPRALLRARGARVAGLSDAARGGRPRRHCRAFRQGHRRACAAAGQIEHLRALHDHGASRRGHSAVVHRRGADEFRAGRKDLRLWPKHAGADGCERGRHRSGPATCIRHRRAQHPARQLPADGGGVQLAHRRGGERQRARGHGAGHRAPGDAPVRAADPLCRSPVLQAPARPRAAAGLRLVGHPDPRDPRRGDLFRGFPQLCR